MTLRAICRRPHLAELERCELSNIEREPVDGERLLEQLGLAHKGGGARAAGPESGHGSLRCDLSSPQRSPS